MLTFRHTARTLSLATMGLAGSLALPPQPVAFAQAPADAQPAPARVLVPTSNQAMMRCEAGAAWYAVATLTTRTPLGSTGTISDGYVQVFYPPGAPAVVKSEEVEVDQATSTATLIRRSRLRAYSASSPVMEECFKAVFDQFLEPGAQLRVIGPINNLSGQPAGWIVQAPHGAKGWVLHSDLRDATPEEIERFTSATGAPAPTGAALGANGALAQSAPAPTSSAPDAGAATSTIEMTDAGADAPVDQVAAFPVGDPSAAPSEEAPLAQDLTPTTEEKLSPTLKALEAAFDRMRRQPVTASDETELLEQYRVLEQQLVTGGASENTMEFISQRISVLELRSQLRETTYEIERLEQKIAGAGESYADSITRLAQTREYLVVGRLMASSLYDGTRMPLLYRLTSIDSAVPRTLAYITPEPALDLDSKTGAVVGVLGAGTLETSAEIGIIKPTAVDILRAAPTSTSDAASQATDDDQ